MSLTMRRNWFLIPLCIVVLLVLVYFGDKRIISFNFWEGGVITTNSTDIENTIDLFDTTQVHEIKILMTDEEYKDMIDTYSSTSEKDWYKTDIVIDWVTIYDVWVRLKWNSSLRGLGWNDMGW
jgi:spore coat protein CotH